MALAAGRRLTQQRQNTAGHLDHSRRSPAVAASAVSGSSGTWERRSCGDEVRLAAADCKHEDSGQQQAEDNVFEHQLAVSVSGNRAAADFGCRA